MWLQLVLSSFVLLTVNSFPTGPPRQACIDMMPIHMFNGTAIAPQNTTSPFAITVNVTSFRPGDVISIRVHSYVRQLFKGIMIQVRPLPTDNVTSYKDEPLGLYYRQIENTKQYTCGNSLDTITHKDPFSKIETRLDWTSPLLLKTDVQVTATVLKDFATFWTDVKSARIKLHRDMGELLPVEKLEKPWVKEIIKTIKAGDDKELRRQLVKERFQKGLKDVVDHNGYIMVNYVGNLLPFEDKFRPEQANFSRKNTDVNVTNSTDVGEGEIDVRSSRVIGIEVPVGTAVVKTNFTTKMSDYDIFLAEVIRGDYTNLHKLSEIVYKEDMK